VTSPSDYITPEGYRRLAAQLDELWKVERPRVTAEVAAAAALGDRSENAEYIYGKRRLREIDRRLRFLRKRLEAVTVVREPPADRGRVFFGAFVTLEDDDGGSRTWQIVGTDEFEVERGRISVASPLARALLGKREDDEIEVDLPRGRVAYVITNVTYRPAGD
jgi:transcription elongation factor GreB